MSSSPSYNNGDNNNNGGFEAVPYTRMTSTSPSSSRQLQQQQQRDVQTIHISPRPSSPALPTRSVTPNSLTGASILDLPRPDGTYDSKTTTPTGTAGAAGSNDGGNGGTNRRRSDPPPEPILMPQHSVRTSQLFVDCLRTPYTCRNWGDVKFNCSHFFRSPFLFGVVFCFICMYAVCKVPIYIICLIVMKYYVNRYINCVVQIYVQQRSEIFEVVPRKYNMTYGIVCVSVTAN
jgi:hypothetical protein